jgi:hypothetical protein
MRTTLSLTVLCQASAETAVRTMLKKRAAVAIEELRQQASSYPTDAAETNMPDSDEGTRLAGDAAVVLYARDRLDDGSTIALAVTIDADSGSAHFDFAGELVRMFKLSPVCPIPVSPLFVRIMPLSISSRHLCSLTPGKARARRSLATATRRAP